MKKRHHRVLERVFNFIIRHYKREERSFRNAEPQQPNDEPQQPIDEVGECPREDLPPDILYHGDIVRGPTTLYRI